MKKIIPVKKHGFFIHYPTKFVPGLLAILFQFILVPLLAQPSLEWKGCILLDFDVVIDEILIGSDGDIYVGGRTNGGDMDIVIAKFDDDNGDTLWVNEYDLSGDDEFIGMGIDASDNIYFVANDESGKRHTYKIASDGSTTWSDSYGGVAGAPATAMAVSTTGIVYSTGYAYTSSNNCNIVTLKYSSAGAYTIIESYNGNSSSDNIDKAYDMKLIGTRLLVVGETDQNGSTEGLVLRYRLFPSIARLSDDTYFDQKFESIQINSSGTAYIEKTYTSASGVEQYLVLSNTGTVLDTFEFPYTTNSNILIDNDDYIYVNGFRLSSSGDTIWDGYYYQEPMAFDQYNNAFYNNKIYSAASGTERETFSIKGYETKLLVSDDNYLYVAAYSTVYGEDSTYLYKVCVPPIAQEFFYSTDDNVACPGEELEVSVTYNAADNISWTPLDYVLNPNDSITGIVTTNNSYGSANSIYLDVYATLSYNNGCTSSPTEMDDDHTDIIIGGQISTWISSGSVDTICDGDRLLLEYSDDDYGNYYYIQKDGVVIDSTSYEHYYITEEGEYSVIVRGQRYTDYCWDTTEALQRDIIPQPTLTYTVEDSIICPGDTFLITGTGGVTSCQEYMWYDEDGYTVSHRNYLEVTEAGYYSLVTYVANGPYSFYCRDTLEVFFDGLALDFDDTDSICENVDVYYNRESEIDLDAGQADSYLWNDGYTGRYRTITEAGTYSVTVTQADCGSQIDSISIGERPVPFEGFGGAILNCSGSSEILDAGTGGKEYTWSTGETTNTITASTEGKYTVFVEAYNDCDIRDFVNLYYISSPDMTMPEDISICGNEPATITPEFDYEETDTFDFGEDESSHDFETEGTTYAHDYLGCTGEYYEKIGGFSSKGSCWINTKVLPTNNLQLVLLHDASENDLFISIDGDTIAGTSDIGSACANDTINITDAYEYTKDGEVRIGLHDTTTAQGIMGGKVYYLWVNCKPDGGTYSWTSDPVGYTSSDSEISVFPSTTTKYYLDYQFGDCSHIQDSITVEAGGVYLGADITACEGDTVELDAGSGKLSYAWSSGETTQTINVTTSGTYIVTVNDASCGSISDTIVVTINAAPSIDLGPDTTVCSSSITLDAGAGMDSYLWSTGATTQTITATTSGSYWVTVENVNGCQGSDTISVIISDIDDIGYSLSSTSVNCNGSSDGSISLYILDDTGDHSLIWSNGETTAGITDLNAGWYIVTIADSNGCSVTDSALVSEPEPIVLTIKGWDASCYESNDGQASVSIEGGTSPYSVTWSNGETTESISDLAAGKYLVEVTDSKSCSETDSVEIDEPEPLAFTVTTESVSCYGGSDGEATVVLSGTYTYYWSNGQDTQTATDLSAGEYSVTVTNTDGCEGTSTIEVESAPIIAISGQVTHVDDETKGAIDITVSGGTGSTYSYLWSNDDTTEDISELETGVYTVTVTDSISCTNDKSFTVNDISCTLTTSITDSSDITCYGFMDGTAEVTASGGTAPYQYSWSNGETTTKITGLDAGDYSVTVTDNDGCLSIADVSISEPDSIKVKSTLSHLSCYNDLSGSISLIITGGIVPYATSWSNGETTETITSLDAGTYKVTIIDNNACSVIDSFTLTEPDSLVLEYIVTDASEGSNGAIDLTVSGGTTPYEFNWSNDESTEDITSLAAGIYFVQVSDANNCTAADTMAVKDPDCTLDILITYTMVTCYGSQDGTATAIPQNGDAPFLYNWSNVQTNQAITDLGAGKYKVTVSDNAGCSGNDSIQITEPDSIHVTFNTTMASAAGNSDGSIDATITGGTEPYSCLWSNSETSTSIANLTKGVYILTVTDDNSCVYIDSTQVEGESIIVNQDRTKSILLYPNPSDGNFVLQSHNAGIKEITVTNTNGQIVYKQKIESLIDEIPLNLGYLKAGLYIIKIIDNDETYFQDILIISN